MLPTVLSDAICSLTENDYRFAFTLDLILEKEEEDWKILDYRFLNTKIKVKKNYRYDTDELENEKILNAYKMVKNLNKTCNMVKHDSLKFFQPYNKKNKFLIIQQL